MEKGLDEKEDRERHTSGVDRNDDDDDADAINRASVQELKPIYDYVVIGGGTAGCVVAARLSEGGKYSVLLVERGQDETNNPGVAVASHNSVLLSVAYETIPAEVEYSDEETRYKAAGSTDSYQLIVPWALGGGPTISGSFWGRGDPGNFKEWEDLGATGWGYKDVLPYYKMIENHEQPWYPTIPVDPSRGTNGPILTISVDGHAPIIQPLVQAAQTAFGLPLVVDYNTEAGQNGISAMQRSTGHNIRHAVRSTTYTGYIRPILKTRRNLQLAVHATVLKINWAPAGSYGNKARAVSIDMIYNNAFVRVKINRELIVSAGTLNTPRLLLVSGVGPKKHLKERGVPVVLNVPGVGRNMTDHMMFTHAFTVDPSKFRVTSDPTPPIIQFSMSDPKSGKIDLEFAWTIMPGEYPVVVMYIVGLRNNHRGYVELKNNDTMYRPYIRYNLAENDEDFDKVILLFKQVKNWFALLKKQGYAFTELGQFANLKVTDPTEVWLAALRATVMNWWHPAGTCRMGNTISDPLAVVDPHLRLRDTVNVRIADNSVQPVVVTTHPSATATIIGERCAEFIRRDFALTSELEPENHREESREVHYREQQETAVRQPIPASSRYNAENETQSSPAPTTQSTPSNTGFPGAVPMALVLGGLLIGLFVATK